METVTNSQIAFMVAFVIAIVFFVPHSAVLTGILYVMFSAILDYLNNA